MQHDIEIDCSFVLRKLVALEAEPGVEWLELLGVDTSKAQEAEAEQLRGVELDAL